MTGKPITSRTRSKPRATIAAVGDRSANNSHSITSVPRRRIVIIGAPADIPRALQHPAVLGGRFAVDGVIALDTDADDAQEVGTRMLETLRDRAADAVLIAGPIGREAMHTVTDLAAAGNCELLAVMPTDMLIEHDPVVVWVGDNPVIQLTRSPRRAWQPVIKRTLDVIGAMLGLVLTAPLMAVLAVLIRLESPGAPVFAHERVGQGGRSFKCLKLRTMRVGAEDVLRSDPALYEEYRQNHFKIRDERDPRTTPLGRFLRRTSLDELPQLWNVVRGDMSLVGPRPVVQEELAMYGDGVDLLLSVRPGVTGAWAVSGRHDIGYPERSLIELSYVRSWSLTQDFRIALGTVRLLAQTQWVNRRTVSVTGLEAATQPSAPESSLPIEGFNS